jgi:anti-sigma regulatory factor (Ser/Thr protein kinase)/DNA-binding NarL/FixJ family response regulator
MAARPGMVGRTVFFVRLRRACKGGFPAIPLGKDKRVAANKFCFMKLLLAGRTPGWSRKFEDILKARGHHIKTLCAGEDPLQVLSETAFHCFIMERLFDCQGDYAICRKIRSVSDFRKIPLVMISEIPDMFEKIKSLNAGADDFLPPAATVEDLERCIKRLVKEREVITLLASTQSVKGILPPSVYPVLKEFFTEITAGKLEFLPAMEKRQDLKAAEHLFQSGISKFDDLNHIKSELLETLERVPLTEERKKDFLTCILESATNAIRYAGGGNLKILLGPSSVEAVLEDQGPGIDLFRLVKGITIRGKTTEETMALGYTVKITLCDKIHLWTGPKGTTVSLEMNL